MAIEKIKLKKGVSYRATIRDKYRNKISKSFRRKVDAEAWERRQIQKRCEPDELPKITFAELIEIWQQRHVKGLSEGTQIRYEQICRKYFLPHFGEKVLTAIDVSDVDEWYHWMQSTKLTTSSINTHLGRLVGIFSWALKRRYIKFNPAAPVDPIREAKNRDKDFCIWTFEQAEMFLDASFEEDFPLFLLCLAALNTGARLGELVGLRWDKVFLRTRLIHIARKWNNKSKRLDNVTKGRESRTVAINDALYAHLAEQKIRGLGPWVFCEPGGERMESDKLTVDRFRPLCERIGVPSLRFHDLRHTFVVHFMQAGGDIYKLQRQLGHKSIETTQQYLRFSPEFTEQLHQVAAMVHFGGGAKEENRVVLMEEKRSEKGVVKGSHFF